MNRTPLVLAEAGLAAGARTADAVVSTPRVHASSGPVLRPRQPNADEDDDTKNEANLAWKAWMKESVTNGTSCGVLDWWKDNSARFPLIA
jgi:hypothetical protein